MSRIDTMKKSIVGKTGKDLLDLCAKYFNEIVNRYYIEFEEVHWNNEKHAYHDYDEPDNLYKTVDDFCSEIAYWLSCYYESGHCRHEEEYKDRFAFIKFLKVFYPLCSETKYIKHWLPCRDEVRFLYQER